MERVFILKKSIFVMLHEFALFSISNEHRIQILPRHINDDD